MIKTNVVKLRDPFVLRENGIYYLYGTWSQKNVHDTEWACFKSDSLDGDWKRTEGNLYQIPENAEKNFWAPEVHKYNGSYYMFATYYSSKTQKRGCSILKSDSPEGTFVEITDGAVTPDDWDAIDGTFWVDDRGQPWMIFVHEWTSTEDGVGRMAAAKLSKDLTHFISEPCELFRADSAKWANAGVTDGCFMYKAGNGDLLMIWSNFCEDGYCVGVAKSKNGEVDGEWVQEDELLFSKKTTGEFDGGHGMIFNDENGKMYLSVHSPNSATAEIGERTLFLPIYEENGNLICKTI